MTHSLLEERDAPAQILPAETLMDRVLRDGAPIAPEYPLVFDPRFQGRLVSVGEGSEVHSACTVLVRDFLIEGTRVRGGMIGSVVTDPAWRSRGLASRVLEAAERNLVAAGCTFALLWAEVPQFYVKRGYGPVGAEVDFALPFELAPRLPEASGVRPRRPADTAAIHALYTRHRVRVDRTLEETEALLACPGMTTLVREVGGEVVGYACRGRGKDLGDAIHEWGGATSDVLALLRAHLEAERAAKGPDVPPLDAGLYLMAPTSARDLYLRLQHLGAPVARGILGLGKILDRRGAAEVLSVHLAPRGFARYVPENAEQPFYIEGPRCTGTLDDEGALALLMGVPQVRHHVTALLERFGLEGAGLPLEPFAWGLDSI